MIHLAALVLCRIAKYTFTGVFAWGGMNFDVPVRSPEQKFMFGGIGVAGRLAGGLNFFIPAVTLFGGDNDVSRLALKNGWAEPYLRRLRSS